MKSSKSKASLEKVPSVHKSITKIKHSASRSQPKQGIFYDFAKILDWIESRTGCDLRTPPAEITHEQIEIRNNKLFPFIKENFMYFAKLGLF